MINRNLLTLIPSILVLFYSLVLSFCRDPSYVLKKSWFFHLCSLFPIYFLSSGLYDQLLGGHATLLDQVKSWVSDRQAMQGYYESHVKQWGVAGAFSLVFWV